MIDYFRHTKYNYIFENYNYPFRNESIERANKIIEFLLTKVVYKESERLDGLDIEAYIQDTHFNMNFSSSLADNVKSPQIHLDVLESLTQLVHFHNITKYIRQYISYYNEILIDVEFEVTIDDDYLWCIEDDDYHHINLIPVDSDNFDIEVAAHVNKKRFHLPASYREETHGWKNYDDYLRDGIESFLYETILCKYIP